MSKEKDVKLTTIGGLDAYAAVSALQKYVRRGMEREAGEIAFQIGASSKQLFSWLCNRLRVISHEDIGLADFQVIVFVETCCQQASQFYPKPCWRLIIGNAVRALCRASKSREGDHYQAACWYPFELEGKVPTIPDWVLDGHTAAGRAMGRGIDYFREVSAQLHPAPQEKDPYEDEAYHYWKLKQNQPPQPRAASDAQPYRREDDLFAGLE